MKIVLSILSLCLFITFSTKRSRNLNICIDDKAAVETPITDSDKAAIRAHIRKHAPIVPDGFTMPVLADDDNSTSFRYRTVLFGLPNYGALFSVHDFGHSVSNNDPTSTYSRSPSRLFNKGSPSSGYSHLKKIYFKIKNRYCLFAVLHSIQLLTGSFRKVSRHPYLLLQSREPTITRLSPFFAIKQTEFQTRIKTSSFGNHIRFFSNFLVLSRIRCPPS